MENYCSGYATVDTGGEGEGGGLACGKRPGFAAESGGKRRPPPVLGHLRSDHK